VKRSISRDFRIQVDEIDNEQSEEEEVEEDDIAKKKFKIEVLLKFSILLLLL